MLEFLLNANLSPETASFLRELGFDVKCLLEENLSAIPDEEVIEIAKKEDRVIVTFDLDFGQIYHFREKQKVGIVVLRLEDQTVESVNSVLQSFFANFKGQEDKIQKSLIIVEKGRYRFYSADTENSYPDILEKTKGSWQKES